MDGVRALLAALAIGVAAAIGAGGCGGDDDDEGAASDRHREAVLAAAEKAVDAGTARADIEIVTEAPEASPSFTATERIDFRSAEAQGVIEFEDVPGLPPNSRADLYTRGPDVYARYDFVEGRPWVRLPSDPLADLTSNPVGLVEAFEIALGEVEEEGETVVDGRQAIRYVGRYDIEALLSSLPEEDRERLERRFAGLESFEVPVTVVVDADGYLREADYFLTQLLPGEATMSVSFELSDFGVDVSFDPPLPEEVIPLRELIDRGRSVQTRA
jgi:hypothetical protein